MVHRLYVLVLVVLTGLLVPSVTVAQSAAGDAHQQLRALNRHVDAARTALAQHDVAQARTEYAAFDAGWFPIEDGVRALSRDSYRAIENAMGDAKYALKQEPIDVAKATAALTVLADANTAFIAQAGTTTTTPAAGPAGAQRSLATELPNLDTALAALARSDGAAARAAIEAFRAVWPDVEGVVAAKDGTVYKRAEDLQAQAAAQLKAEDYQAASSTILQLKTDLQPFASSTLTYGVFDAMSILLREGLEALLIIAALLAFLQKSGNADKRRWIWLGGAAGVVASILTAVAIQLLFSAFVTGANRELVEGITGLVAAVLLFYVSYWLHSKSHLGGWQRYLKDRTNAALATGSLVSLAALAFLSVFREGAETALFYIGIAPAIALRDLLLGMSLGTVLLTVVGIVVIGLGKRIPLTPFFRITSLLIWYLGFKFIGSGIRALQIARVVPETSASFLPSSGVLGLYPTWETTIPQLALIVGAIAVVVWLRAAAKQSASLRTSINP